MNNRRSRPRNFDAPHRQLDFGVQSLAIGVSLNDGVSSMVKSSGWMQIYRASKAIDHSYIHLILQGKRRPHRDVLISL